MESIGLGRSIAAPSFARPCNTFPYLHVAPCFVKDIVTRDDVALLFLSLVICANDCISSQSGYIMIFGDDTCALSLGIHLLECGAKLNSAEPLYFL